MYSTFSLTLAQDAPPPTGAPLPGQSPTTTTAPAPAPGGTEQAPVGTPKTGPFDGIWPMLILFLVIFWVMILLPQRKEKRKRAELLSSIKKGDRVQTMGGLLATVAEVKDAEVVLKVDEANNTRMHFAKGAIVAVLPEGKPINPS